MITNDEHNRAAFEYNCAIHSTLLSICNPLFTNLGVKNFRYMKMYNNAKYISLGTNLNYIKAYLQSIDQPGKLFEPSRIFSHGFMDNTNFCHFLWPIQYEPYERDPLYNLVYEFDIWHGFTISRAGPNYVETWSFTADRHSTEMPQFYIRNTNIFNCFVLYFDSKIQSIIETMPKSAFATFKTPFNVNVATNQLSNKNNVVNFFKSLDLSRFPVSSNNVKAYLTSKEIECFTHIALGNTAKQVGKTLNVSSRTVEAHLGSIKEKLGVTHKSDIMSIIPYEQLLLLKKIFLMKSN